MRRHSAFAIGILVGALILAAAVPAHAAPRFRVYRGDTSQEGQRIAFRVAKTDAGRFVRVIDLGVTFACEDGTTQEWGIGWFLGGNYVPITDGAFSFESVDSSLAIHLEGRLGPLRGEGTLSLATAALTADEQAQLCTTGDLTWEVEFVRTITRTPLDAAAGFRPTHRLAFSSWFVPVSTCRFRGPAFVLLRLIRQGRGGGDPVRHADLSGRCARATGRAP